jgi:hypothetical protein
VRDFTWSTAGTRNITSLPVGSYTFDLEEGCGKKVTITVPVGPADTGAVMGVTAANIRKSFNCRPTGMLPVSFSGGLPPYNVVMTSYPFEYTGVTTGYRATAGTIEFDDLPAGVYSSQYDDGCGKTLY